MCAIRIRIESKSTLKASVEVNEIHAEVSRSFERPKATRLSLLPVCQSLWNIKEMKTLHILEMLQLTAVTHAANEVLMAYGS